MIDIHSYIQLGSSKHWQYYPYRYLSWSFLWSEIWKWIQAISPNIWIFKFFIIIVLGIKMLSDIPYVLLNHLKFKHDQFGSLFIVEFEFQKLNVGGKMLEFLSQPQIRGDYNFS